MERLVEMVKQHEGFRQTVYKDSVGKMTVGFGLNVEDKGVSEWEAEFLLRNHLLELEAQLKEYEWFRIQDRVRKDALIDLAYNLGVTGLLQFKRMIRALKAKDYTQAKAEALDSKWARQVGVRADKISGMIESGEY